MGHGKAREGVLDQTAQNRASGTALLCRRPLAVPLAICGSRLLAVQVMVHGGGEWRNYSTVGGTARGLFRLTQSTSGCSAARLLCSALSVPAGDGPGSRG